jgi:hypothetical protein
MGTASLVAVFHLVAAAVKRTLERGRKTRKTSRKKTKRRGHGRRLVITRWEGKAGRNRQRTPERRVIPKI